MSCTHMQLNPTNLMNFIQRMLSLHTPTITTKLGRWNLHYDPKIVNSKVDQANEDHCGCCHDAPPVPINATNANEAVNPPSEDYYIPYVMSPF